LLLDRYFAARRNGDAGNRVGRHFCSGYSGNGGHRFDRGSPDRLRPRQRSGCCSVSDISLLRAENILPLCMA
jgi:hypothetical protein